LTVNSYRDLRIWQLAMDMAEGCYVLTRVFPKDELYGLVSQIRRAATSIAANIAEGHGRETTGNFIQFLRVAQGSLKELETHLLISARLGFAEETRCKALLANAEELGKMVRAMIRNLQEKS
jgi:four helix bundle protein